MDAPAHNYEQNSQLTVKSWECFMYFVFTIFKIVFPILNDVANIFLCWMKAHP